VTVRSTVHEIALTTSETFTTKPTKGSEELFRGFLINIGTVKVSSVSTSQFRALQRIQDVKLDTTRRGTITFSVDVRDVLGVVTVNTPLGVIEARVVDISVPFLVSLANIDRLGAYYNNLTNFVIQKGKPKTLVYRYRDHAWVLFDTAHALVAVPDDCIPEVVCHLTEPELRQLYRRFGHPSVRRLSKLLERTDQE
jgi:hypothetical protein